MDSTTSPCPIRNIILEESIRIAFQPIFSVRSQQIVLAEALARHVPAEGTAALSPYQLFRAAAYEGVTLALDRLCRKLAFGSFRPLHERYPNLLLTVNFESSLLDDAVVASGYMLEQVRHAGLDPHRIVIEIVESEIGDETALQRFIEHYRTQGFLIALDDFGAGHSNLGRIPLIQPDIIKVDRGLLDRVDEQYHKREVLKAILGLANQVGALTIAEGVEREEEVATALAIGYDLFQGYFFAKPAISNGAELPGPGDRLGEAGKILRRLGKKRVESHAKMIERLHRITGEVGAVMAHTARGRLEARMREVLDSREDMVCLYILDDTGVQITDTVFSSAYTGHRSGIFQPARKGADQSLKEYFYLLRWGMEPHTTAPYISQATGDLCVTTSLRLRGADGCGYVLCCDFCWSADFSGFPLPRE